MSTPLIIERIFDASIQDVWQAITQKELMKKWYFDLPEFKAEVGFKWEFWGGPSPEKQFLHKCEILEVIPFKKLSHTWNYDGYTGSSIVTFEISEIDGKTVLILTHSGLETFPTDVSELAAHNFVEGWDAIINTNLFNYLKNNNNE